MAEFLHDMSFLTVEAGFPRGKPASTEPTYINCNLQANFKVSINQQVSSAIILHNILENFTNFKSIL